MKKIITLSLGALLLSIMLFAFLGLRKSFRAESLGIPETARGVRILEEAGLWQSYKLLIVFEAPPEVCLRFARDFLVRDASDAISGESEFDRFPVGIGTLDSFPSWFNPNTVEDGILFTTKSGRIALVDLNGMFYYYEFY